MLLVAKKRSALRSLHDNYVKKGCKKITWRWCAVSGIACEERSSAVIEKYSAKRRAIVRVSQEGKPSETRFKVEERMLLPPWCVVAR